MSIKFTALFPLYQESFIVDIFLKLVGNIIYNTMHLKIYANFIS
jgi:hypothetical protein